MKRQYKVYWTGRIMPGYGIKSVHAESEEQAKKIAKEKYKNVDIDKVEVIK